MTCHPTVLILGATGRTGREVARQLASADVHLVITGRDPVRLATLAAELGDVEQLVGDLAHQLEHLRRSTPSVVVNTVGPFTSTAERVVDACPPGTHYVDVANELDAVTAVLDRDQSAVRRGSTLVTGAGFGVLGTESATLRLCADRPAPTRLRVDAIPSLASEAGVVGTALAGSNIDGLPRGGRRVSGGRLVRARVADEPEHLTTPDGDAVSTAALPSGELVAAWRASDATEVVAASSAVPAARGVPTVFGVLSVLCRIGPLRRALVRLVAGRPIRAAERTRAHTWARATGHWDDGSTHQVWLRAGDAMTFTAAAAAEVAQRLARGDGRPGAFTPGALFGPELATAAGASFV